MGEQREAYHQLQMILQCERQEYIKWVCLVYVRDELKSSNLFQMTIFWKFLLSMLCFRLQLDFSPYIVRFVHLGRLVKFLKYSLWKT